MTTEFYGVSKNYINIKDLAKTLSDMYSYGVIKYALIVCQKKNNNNSHHHFYIIFKNFVRLERLEYLLGKKIFLFDINQSFEKIRKYMLGEDNALTFEIGFRNEDDL